MVGRLERSDAEGNKRARLESDKSDEATEKTRQGDSRRKDNAAPLSKKARTDATEEDPIEDDSEDDNNAFMRFKRPGAVVVVRKKPTAPPASAKGGRPTRAAVAAANGQSAGSKPGIGRAGNREPELRRSGRAASAAAQQRIRDRGDDDSFLDDDEEGSDSGDEQPKQQQQQRARRGKVVQSESEAEDSHDEGGDEGEEADVEMVDGSSSGDDSDLVDDDDAGTRRRPTRGAAPRPSARPTRASARSRQPVIDEESDEEEEDDDDEEEEVVAVKPSSRVARASRGRPTRPAARGSGGRRGAGLDESSRDDDGEEEEGSDGAEEDGDADSDVEVVGGKEASGEGEDEEEESEEEDEEEHESEEEESGRGRPRRAAAAAAAKRVSRQQKEEARGGDRRRGAERAAKGAKPDVKKQQQLQVQKGPAAGGKEPAAIKLKKDKGPTEPVERILSYDADTGLYHIKLEGVSYRRTARVTHAFLEAKKPALLRTFVRSLESRDASGPSDGIYPDWTQVDRVISHRKVSRGSRGPGVQYLVKWRDLEYSDATWEWQEELQQERDKAAIESYKRFDAPRGKDGGGRNTPSLRALRTPDWELPAFCSGRKLREYQEVSVRWMVNNMVNSRNCILGDEMGLGKTAQSISVLQTLRQVGGVEGPFLVVAPLSTLPHWQREIQTWTDMNVVLFAGSAKDRDLIEEYEFYRSGGGGSKRGREVKFHVLLVSYDTLLKERSRMRSFSWSAAVFDEAHRLKGLNSATRQAVEEMDIGWKLLLTGTPIQNNMLELFSILNLLDPEEYPSQEDFVERFGGSPGGPPPTVEQIKQLQEALAPVLLRRMKEDVEELPQKEEVVIWVELTSLQRQYYRAVYEGQIGALLGGPGVKSLPGMRNLAMELRKLCCHPVLCDGLENDLMAKLMAQRAAHAAGEGGGAVGYTPFPGSPELELLVRGSGKMLLLHKLLPKLRGEGRRVLIFSQFVIMLNVLEDYCRAAGWPVERLDGSITGRARQQAIDRFCATDTPEDESSAPFVFLLSTRAGGQGITLTTADTVIIYDSDWNPQNDLQAMARCHRIGQTKEVTVYRLISRDTYEMALFSTASRKYGLDEAILGFSAGSDPEADSSRIAALLRHGAHGLLGDMEAGQRQGEAFASEDIGHILAQRTEKRQIGSRAGNTFSVATFVVDEDPTGADAAPAKGSKGGKDAQADAEYWRALMPDAVAAHEAKAAEGPVVLGPRQRRKVCYALDKMDKELEKHLNSSDDDSGNGKGSKGAKGAKEDGKENNADGEQGAADGAAGAGERPAKRRKKKAKEETEGSADPAAGEAAEGAGKDAEGAAKEAKQKGPRGRQLRPAWSKPEVKALEDRLLGLGAGRLADLHAAMQPTKRSPEEVVEAGAALWELMQLAERLVGDREVDAVKARADELRAKLAAAAAGTGTAAGVKEAGEKKEAAGPKEGAGEGEKKEQEEEGGEGKEEGEKKGGEGKDKDKDRPLDAYEQKLATAAELLPESIRAALCSAAAVRRLMKDSRSAIRHMRMMQELQDIMKPQPAPAPTPAPQPSAEGKGPAGEDGPAAAAAAASASPAAAAGGVTAPAPALRVGPVPITGNLPSWWTRADDEALLMAAVQVGYTPGVPRRTVEHALTSPDLGLAAKVRLLAPPPQQDQEQQQGQGATAEAGATAMEVDAKPSAEQQPQQEQAAAAAGDAAKSGQAEAMDVDAAKPQGDGDQQQEQQKDGQQQKEEEGAKDGSAAAAKEEAPQAAGGATAAAATAAAQPKANKDSHEFTPDEYKALVKELSRRLSTLVRVTVDFRRRAHTARPVAAPKPAPAAKPPVPTTAAPSPAAANAANSKPSTISPAARPGSGAPSSAVPAGDKPAPAGGGGKASAPLAGSAAASSKGKDSSDAKAPAATAAAAPAAPGSGTGSAPPVAGNGAATGAAAPKPASAPAQAAGSQQQPVAGKAAPKERPGSGRPGMKQSVLPFGRLPLAKSNPNVSAVANAVSPPGTGCGKAAAAAGKGGDNRGMTSPRPADAPAAQPPFGSPHGPIEVD